ncbi:proline-rich transmembrane protein 1-like [Pecten maximus]|uniref:proline-rich transmembrane protein 1-like n=1 Tax=Pecten maximus TaxID=6579 RepID=UPI001458B55B|nr:proline-rich transmembrane protein 1-like [Pecten maximus]XP_033752533.1 proline-rich transmembrane protein 1-like [Pecten maximus]
MEHTPSTSTASSKASVGKKRHVHYYMMPAVFVTLFCFWPTGIMAIMKVTDIDEARKRGDAIYLQTSKSAAKKWIGISLLFGVVVVSTVCSVIGWQIFLKS